MKAQIHTEEVLKAIHVLFSKAPPYAGSKVKVVVDKEKMMALLKELSDCMYDMMDEYELSSQSREKAEREAQKRGDELMLEARKNAEDIYAASLIYSDRALEEIRGIMEDAGKQIDVLQDEIKEKIREKTIAVRTNQSELKGQLTTLIDTQKYLHIIEDENARIEREKESEEIGHTVRNKDKDISAPEIIINEAYFKKAADLDADNIDDFSEEDIDPAELAKLDAEYFDWKDEED